MILSVGQEFQLEICVTEPELSAFAEISGDFNPLHVDDVFARNAGFRGRVVHGAFLAARVSQLIGMRCPGRDALLTRMDLSFHAPLVLWRQSSVERTYREHIFQRSAGVHVDLNQSPRPHNCKGHHRGLGS